MSLDAFTLKALVHELGPALEGGLLQRASQLGEHELLLGLRRPGRTWRLRILLQPGRAGFHPTEGPSPPALVPSSFVMLVRKHMMGRPLVSLRQPGLERAVHLQIGDWTLVAELAGQVNNLFLLHPDGRVAGAWRADAEPARRLRPGRPYEAPPRPALPEAIALDGAGLAEALAQAQTQAGEGGPARSAAEALTRAVFGIPPLQARHLCRLAGIDPAAPLTDPSPLAGPWDALRRRLVEGPWEPVRLPDGQTSPWPLGLAGERPCPSLAEALDDPGAPPSPGPGLPPLLGQLRKARARAERLLQRRQEDLARAGEAAGLQRQAELLLAHARLVPPGAARVELPDWDGPPLEIPLDPSMGPIENAQALFRRARRLKRAVEALQEPLARARQEIAFLDELLLAAEGAGGPHELEELAALWQEHRGGPTRSGRRRPAPSPGPRRYRFDGFQILVGRNPRQNEKLSLQVAARDDLWLHARDLPGAHVILRRGGRTPPLEAVLAAATLAARFSQGARDSSVTVVVTEARKLRRPPGSPPGTVLYRGETSLQADPQAETPGLEKEDKDSP